MSQTDAIADGSLRIVARSRDHRSEAQQSFDAIRLDAIAEANAVSRQKQAEFAGRSDAAKSLILAQGFGGLAADLTQRARLEEMLAVLAAEFPDMHTELEGVKTQLNSSAPASAADLRDMLRDILQRSENSNPEAFRRAQQMLERIHQLLAMSDTLLKELARRDRQQA